MLVQNPQALRGRATPTRHPLNQSTQRRPGSSPIGRPAPGDIQDYPIHGPGTWTEWSRLSSGAQAQARVLDRAGAQPGCLCLVANQSGRILRVLGPTARRENA